MKLPGFVDLQVNGYKGVDFLNPNTTVDDLLDTARTLREAGTAGYLLTVTTNGRDAIETNIRHAREAMDRQGPKGPILGIHLEGPFISPEYGYRGAHVEKYISPPDLIWFQRLQELARGAIRLVTLAPEMPGAVEFTEAVADTVVVAMGHANPSYEELRRAIDAGLSLVTHFGNGVRPDIQRHHNILVNTLACPELTLCMISDGHHLPDPFLRMLIHCVGVERLVVVSDMVMYAGLPPGDYPRENYTIRLQVDGRLCLAHDPKLLYGSSATMLECVNHLNSLGLLTPQDIETVAYTNPMAILGLSTDRFPEAGPEVVASEERGAFQIR